MLTFDELLKEYFFVRHLKPRTQHSYQGALAQFTKNMDRQGLRLASEVTQFHILTWRKIALSEIREVSWNCYVRHLRALYNFGIDQGLLNTITNPFKGVTIREPKKPKKTLSKTQIDATRAVLSADSTPFGHSAHTDPDTYSTIIRTGSRSAATQGWHC